MPVLSIILVFLLTTACGWVSPLVSEMASTSSEQFFTERQREDIINLLDGILYAESCKDLRDSIYYNPTLQELETEYDLNEGFFHEEMHSFYSLTTWTKTSQENYLARGIVTAWLAEANMGTVQTAVDRAKTCHTGYY